MSEPITELKLSHGRYLNKGTVFSSHTKRGKFEFIDATVTRSGRTVVNALDLKKRHMTSMYLEDVKTVHKKETAQHKAFLADVARRNAARREAMRRAVAS